ncbi:MerR family DNA-binding transcriptional regulator [Nocardia salmonicida]|uniref:MerR family DNA-binding transcriptional regulator n=1 Tax=Nocardia salmonicida TaxID=53431 RepID=UPI003F4D3F33
MRIGELSTRTGVNTHQLRYYEAQGLMSAHRSPNGYRPGRLHHRRRTHNQRHLPTLRRNRTDPRLSNSWRRPAQA